MQPSKSLTAGLLAMSTAVQIDIQIIFIYLYLLLRKTDMTHIRFHHCNYLFTVKHYFGY